MSCPSSQTAIEELSMDTQLSEIPFLSNLGIMVTYKCPVACPHCIVEAGPNRKEEMLLGDCLAWINQASTYKDGQIKSVSLTGGEPFYDLNKLALIAEYGKAFGFNMSVVTSAFWASTQGVALKILSELPALDMISISTDVYHQNSIPFDNIENAVWAARKLRKTYNISVCTDNEENPEHQKVMGKLKAIGEEDNIRVSITFPVGRAQQKKGVNYRIAAEPTVSACDMAGMPIIFPNGNVIGCIGPLITLPPMHPLFLGNLHQEKLSEIFQRSELNMIQQIIRIWGPYKLVSLLKENGMEALLPRSYVCNSICDVCYQLLSDVQIVDALQTILQNEQMRQTVAYARVYYLHEETLAKLLHLDMADRAAQAGSLVQEVEITNAWE
jgi:MoaA/NifB/PqqE/SkfB family radical SAM enzyme